MAEVVIERSKFIAQVMPTPTEEDARAFIEKVRKEHSLATHNCYAYVCEKGAIKRFSDDGEPSGTAGTPMLDVIVQQQLVDVCVVVTRYFGGVKLGAGGLVRAYSKTTAEGIRQSGKVDFYDAFVLQVEVPYDKLSRAKQIASSLGRKILSVDYKQSVVMQFAVLCDQLDSVQVEFNETFKGDAIIDIINREYIIF